MRICRAIAIFAAATGFFLPFCSPAFAESLKISTLSTRPETVSGGEVLVRIDVPAGIDTDKISVTLNGDDVTVDFHPGPTPGSTIGLVRGLKLGKNSIAATVGGKGHRQLHTQLAVANHPIIGPVFSGPHQRPFVCETIRFVLWVTGGTLGPPIDQDCSVLTRIDYVYMSTDGRMHKLANPASHPPDLARTTTSQGRTVNYIVRIETGTINRAIYQTAILYDPMADPSPDVFHPPAGWNHRLIYTFGGNCAGGYHQGTTLGDSIGDRFSNNFLAQGYAMASSTLNVLGNGCNDVLSAETMMMVKEHFIDEYGVPAHTIGWGGSGGAVQQQLIAQNYPGLLDGLLPAIGFPDVVTLVEPVTDCALLNNAVNILNHTNYPINYCPASCTYPQKDNIQRCENSACPDCSITCAQMDALAGFHSWRTCAGATGDTTANGGIIQAWMNAEIQPHVALSPGMLIPGVVPRAHILAGAPPGEMVSTCYPYVPHELVYDPVKNPHGVRCDMFDSMVNVYGSSSGAARRPVDSVGVQYGLAAYNAGRIDWEKFIALNSIVGGYDRDGNIIPGAVFVDGKVTSNRTVADDAALQIAYRTGRVVSAAGGRNPQGLADIPIIALQVYLDDVDNMHASYGPLLTRARLKAAYGNAPGYLDDSGIPKNQIIVTIPHPPSDNRLDHIFSFDNLFDYTGKLTGINVLALMDKWLDKVDADHSENPAYLKAARARPIDLSDGCFYQDAGGRWRENLEPAVWSGLFRKAGPAANFGQCKPGPGFCACRYPSYGDPRIAAGAPIGGEVLKCGLKPIDSSDYRGGLTADRRLQLSAIFPDGVCDWTKPGRGQQPPSNSWLSFPRPGHDVSLNH
ncbi:MAG TPA: DUF6351 family protein [Candidatus Binataceae bacterium]|nr:DUF6351 family protein [Candidatus Binataceae bacterium]